VRGYSDLAADHFRHPRNAGELPGANGVGTAGNPADGDHLRLAVRIENGRIVAAAFQTLGCPAAIAAGSMATELLRGRTVDEALRLRNRDVVAALGGLPPGKEACSVLAEEAVRAAVENYRIGAGGFRSHPHHEEHHA